MPDFLATNVFAGTGAIMQVEIDFAGYQNDLPGNPAPYLKVEDVKAKVVTPATATSERVETPITLLQVNALTFQTEVNIPVGDELWVYRQTEDRYTLTDFKNLQSVSERDLDLAVRQLLYIAQESKDLAEAAYDFALEAQEFARDLGGIALEELAEVREQAEQALAIANALAVQVAAITNGPFSPPYNAKGDGVTDDTAAFAAWEAIQANRGRVVDLGGKTILIQAVPDKCAYINGKFVLIEGINRWTRCAQMPVTFLNQPGRYVANGGQLARMRQALSDPFFQFVGIVLGGDSITWGSGTGENLPFDPRNGTLKDPRDSHNPDSYVNIFKRYVGKHYAGNVAPILSNFPYSPQGESISTYIKPYIMVPEGPGFTVQVRGAAFSQSKVAAATTTSKWQYRYTDQNTAGTSYAEIAWTMTGKSFTLHLSCVANQGLNYEVFVNDVSYGVFGNFEGAAIDGGGTMVSPSNNNPVTHTFPFTRNARIRIRTQRNGTQGTSQVLRIDAIILNKTIRIANQGINGTTARNYTVYAMGPSAPGFSGTTAIQPDDSFFTIQLGSNDRGMNAAPQTPTTFQQEMENLIGFVPAGCEPIILCANPAKDTPGALLTMADIRASLQQLARRRGIDFVDNYAAWGEADPYALSNDGLHPNPQGFQIMAQNLIRSMENAEDPTYVVPAPPVALALSYPFANPSLISVTRVGTAQDEVDREAASAILGRQYLFRNGNLATSGNYHRIRFTLTGSSRLRFYYSLNASASDFELYINGVYSGSYQTDGTPAYQQYYDLPLPANSSTVPVNIEMRTLRRADQTTGTVVLYAEALGIDAGATLTAWAP